MFKRLKHGFPKSMVLQKTLVCISTVFYFCFIYLLTFYKFSLPLIVLLHHRDVNFFPKPDIAVKEREHMQ